MRFLVLSLWLNFSGFLFLNAQQSTTGEVPPAGIDLIGVVQNVKADAEYLIPDVPAYNWRYGCGPTALGMVLGYYDIIGYYDIFPGDASTQTPLVNQFIASVDNYDDYCMPIDIYPLMNPDLSELPTGDEHADNCIADFMLTSQSYVSNFYGWSWSYDVEAAFNNYLAYVSSYTGTCVMHSFSSFSFSAFTNEMNCNRPMMALVDTDDDGYTDHFITLVGYRQLLGVNYYGCYQTWDQTIHWYEWAEISSSQPWGIYCVFSFLMNPTGTDEPNDLLVKVYPNPASSLVFIKEADTDVRIYDICGKHVLDVSSDESGRIDISDLQQGLYYLEYVSGGIEKCARCIVE